MSVYIYIYKYIYISFFISFIDSIGFKNYGVYFIIITHYY